MEWDIRMVQGMILIMELTMLHKVDGVEALNRQIRLMERTI